MRVSAPCTLIHISAHGRWVLQNRHRVVLAVMLIWGCANPKGEDDTYNGLFLTGTDISQAVEGNSLIGLPVKIEHTGVAVGKVVVAWDNDGKLDLLIDVNEKILEGGVVSRFVQNNICQDLSLGYGVDLQYSEHKKTYVPAKKVFNEVSIVKRGAREHCHIMGYSVTDTVEKTKKDPPEPTKKRKMCDFASF